MGIMVSYCIWHHIPEDRNLNTLLRISNLTADTYFIYSFSLCLIQLWAVLDEGSEAYQLCNIRLTETGYVDITE